MSGHRATFLTWHSHGLLAQPSAACTALQCGCKHNCRCFTGMYGTWKRPCNNLECSLSPLGGVQRKCPTLHPSSTYPMCVGGCQRTRSRRRVKPNPDSRSFVGSKPSREGQLAIRERKKSLRVLVGLIHFRSAGPAQQRVQNPDAQGKVQRSALRRCSCPYLSKTKLQ